MFFSNKNLLALLVSIPILFFLVSSVSSFKEIDGFAVNESNLSTEVNVRTFIDVKDRLTTTNFLTLLEEDKLDAVDRSKLGFSDYKHWHYVKIENFKSKRQRYALHLDNPTIDRMFIYKRKFNELVLISTLGDLNTSQPSVNLALPTVRVELESSTYSEYVIVTETNGSYFLPIKLYLEDNFARYKTAVLLLWGAFIGVVILMSVYNLILFLGVKDKLYIVYIAYIILFLVELGIVHGYNFYLLGNNVASFIAQYIITLNFLLGLFTLKFGLRFLKINKTTNKRLSDIGHYLGLLMMLGTVLSLFLGEKTAASVFFICQTLLYLYVINLLMFSWKQGVRWAKYYTFSWLPLLVGAAIGSMLFMGEVGYSFWTRHALLLSVMFEMSFISMALAERLRISEAERLHQASHDPASGLPNVSKLIEVSKVLESKKESLNFSAVVVSINQFSSIAPYLSAKDLGVLVDDLVSDLEEKLSEELMLANLGTVANRECTAIIREGVFGFVVTSTDTVLLQKVLQEIVDNQPKTFIVGNLTLKISYTLGVASIEDCDNGSVELPNNALQAVDYALHNNKGLQFFEERTTSQNKLQLANVLGQAIEQKKLYLVYQEQHSLKDDSVTGYEVLVRWNEPKLDSMSTDEFIEIAEETGLINRVTECVFEMACIELNELQKQSNFKGTFSINVSIQDIMSAYFISFLISTLNRYDVSAHSFVIEITEHAGNEIDPEYIIKLNNLAELGFTICIDNFGEGHSSISYISRLPIKQLKIDRSIMSEIDVDETKKEIAKACVNIAHSLGYETIAEGVETKECLNIAKVIGCDHVQGYLVDKPSILANKY